MKTLNTINKTLIALVAGAVLTTGANAAVNYNSMGQAYAGVKVGQFDVDVEGVDTDKPTAYGVYGGYDFGQGFGAEAEYLTSTDADFTNNGTKGEFNTKSYGAYGTYRYNFPNSGLYAKGKLGFAKSEIKVEESEKHKDSGVAGGIGLGLNLSSNLSLEGEYAVLPSIDVAGDDVDVSLMSVGAHLKF